ncbi:MAG: hypothetical protein KAI43_04450 [Candidatus Aureabacteria bacterium]|nr:hypothetical protein [Candidatus Auribacterota bacterium]
MKKNFLLSLIMIVALMPATFVFAGGDDTGDGEELKGALEDEIYKRQNLEDKVADLENQINDLKNRPAQIIEKETVVKEGGGDYTLPIHGFFNVNYADPNYPGREGTFDQENFNIYLDYVLDENFKFFGEIGTRHGEEIDVDLTSVNGVGEVNIVRAWLDWKKSDALILKFGKFLTPYGKWNLEHSPAVYLSIWDPLLIRRDLFPKSVTGVQLYGTRPLGAADLIYNVYLGNGKGWRAHSADDNTNKGIGTRIALLTNFFSAGTIEFGFNGYTGRDGTLNDEDENVLGYDFMINAYPIQLRGEYAKSEAKIAATDWERKAWFIQTSYNFLEKYDAYLRYDKEEDSDVALATENETSITSFGINYKPIPKVAFKLEYDIHDPHVIGTYEVIAASCAVAF